MYHIQNLFNRIRIAHAIVSNNIFLLIGSFNYALGACAAGSVVGYWRNCHVTGWNAAAFFCKLNSMTELKWLINALCIVLNLLIFAIYFLFL